MGFLSEVVERVRSDLVRAPLDESALMARAMYRPPARAFEEALRRAEAPAIVAEIKRASPSAGPIAETEPADRARAYEAGGAAALSVLTEPRHFDGSLADLRAARSATSLPVLRKDFLVHPVQLIEARAEGADAVLLIAAALSDAELKAMLAAAGDLGLGVVLETHAERDLERALASEARVIGVNARDLETLEVDLERALALARRLPSDRLALLESGISTREHVERALEAGARAVLVGEALMRSADPAGAIRELRGQA